MADQPTNAQLAADLHDAATYFDSAPFLAYGQATKWKTSVRLAAQRLEAREEISEAKVQTMWVELVKRNNIAANLAGEDIRAALEAAREA